MGRRRMLGGVAALLALGLVTAACRNGTASNGTSEAATSQSSPTIGASDVGRGAAVDAVCTAKDDFSAALTTVLDDLRSGNLSTARAQLAHVRSTAADLTSAIGTLSSQERQRLEPLVDRLNQDLQTVTQARRLDQLGRAVDAVRADAAALRTALTSDLRCTGGA